MRRVEHRVAESSSHKSSSESSSAQSSSALSSLVTLDCVSVAICGGMPLFFGSRRIGDGGVSHFVERRCSVMLQSIFGR